MPQPREQIEEDFSMVRVVNNGDTPFIEGFHNRSYSFQPGQERFVPEGAAKLWAGDWTLINESPQRQPRRAGLNALRTRYGVGDMNAGQWDERRPNIAVFDMEGRELPTILIDPEGDLLEPTTGENFERDRMLSQMQAMQKQIQMMQAHLDSNQTVELPVDSGETRIEQKKIK